MPIAYRVLHRTRYSYAQPVQLGRHRMMLRPRDSHEMRLLDTGMTILPEPVEIRWVFDVYGNSIALASFGDEPTSELVVESRLELEHHGLNDPSLPIAPFAQAWPFNYTPEELPDLAPYLARHWHDPAGEIDRWARSFVKDKDEIATQDLLLNLSSSIKSSLPYHVRHEEGTQSPGVTLAEGGTCRDFAALMMEALRSLKIAARFVSGYLYVPTADPAQQGQNGGSHVGGGATHAWVDVFLPGAGWVEFDPTNALFGGTDLIRVGAARAPELVSPISGAFIGPAGVGLPIEVDVTVETL